MEVLREAFDELNSERWREVEVAGHAEFSVVELDGERVLRASSRDTGSILLTALRFNPDDYEWISWRWRVDTFADGEDLATKRGSDAAARVYVYFDTPGLPWQRRNIDYVWSDTLPVGTILPSAFSKASMIIVAESGRAHQGRWRHVVRDLEKDYKACFGEDPPAALAVGLMTDSDNTNSASLAYFDDLVISRRRPDASPGY